MTFDSSHLPFLTLKTLAYFLIGLGLFYLALILTPLAKAQALFYYYQTFPRQPRMESFADLIGVRTGPQGFGEILKIPLPLNQAPVNTDFALIIDKINVNAPVVDNVSVTDKKVYLEALKSGVAHAAGTALPSGEAGAQVSPGNTYLFAHSTLNPLEIKKYSASFTLLSKLQKDDRVVVFYQGKRFDYLVKEKEVVDGFATTVLTRRVLKPTLTLQTCDPPGVPLNRLIVTAELEGVYEKMAL